jgi:hypothetical protein
MESSPGILSGRIIAFRKKGMQIKLQDKSINQSQDDPTIQEICQKYREEAGGVLLM